MFTTWTSSNTTQGESSRRPSWVEEFSILDTSLFNNTLSLFHRKKVLHKIKPMASITQRKIQYKEGGRWHDFQPQTSSSLLSQHASGSSTGSFTFRHVTYTIDFTNMQQTNTQTNFQRKLRIVAAAPSSTWEWNEGRQWTPYDARTQAAFNAAIASNQYNLNIQFGSTVYQIDLQNMKQTNTKTGFARNIRGPSSGSSSSSGGGGGGGTSMASGYGTNSSFSGYGGTSSSNNNNSSTHISFTSVNSPDWSSITQWNRIQPNTDYNPNDTDLMGENLGQGGDDEPVVRLKCSTTQIPCVFRASLIQQCLSASNGECPTCKYKYNTPGPQPSGTLTISKSSQSCSGYNCGSLHLSYQFPHGTQGPRMLRPNQHYAGTSRIAYLPDNDGGNEALELLTKAFKGGNLFVVGDSVTTGHQNTTVWAGIHQKTRMSGGKVGHGYPDPNYFDRLKQECGARGIFTNAHEQELLNAKNKTDSSKSPPSKKSKTNSSSGSSGSSGDGKSENSEKSEKSGGEEMFVPQEGDNDLDRRIQQCTNDLNAAMAARNTNDIRNLMKLRNECQTRKKLVDQQNGKKKNKKK